MEKCFVLDTNVLLHDPESLKAFGDNKVIIPIYVIEEIDNFKKEQTELGRNARQVSRTLDKLRTQGNLLDGVSLNPGTLQIRFTQKTIPEEFIALDQGADSKILAVALEANGYEEGPVTLVTKDLNLRIRASAIGLATEDYHSTIVQSDNIFSGFRKVRVDQTTIDQIFSERQAPLPNIRVPKNSFGILTAGPNSSALVRFYPEKKIMVPIRTQSCWGLTANNKEQQFAMELLLDDSIKLVTISGKAGTGKTLLALAAGMEKVGESKDFRKLLVSRPVFPMGKDIGFLPGDTDEKLRPWMQPIYDNLEFLMGLSEEDRRKGRSPDELFSMDLIQVEPLTYIRGRSIPKQFILVDESQNLTPHEVKTIITRAGADTKIVLTGDPDQIDNPYIDATNNGLVHVINSFKGQSIFGHITLTRGERSELAEVAAKLL